SVLVEVALAFPAASIAAPAGMLATTVPGPVIPLTVTVYVGPVPLTVAVRVPGAVLPVKVTSPPVNPETGSLNTTVKLTGAALVGSACEPAWSSATAGATLSNVRVSTFDAAFPTPPPLVAAPA